MALKINTIQPDNTNKRGSINFWDPEPTTNEQVNVSVAVNLTGNETLKQADDMVKARAKQVLQEALALL